MSILEQLEAAGEVLSPAVRAALALLEAQVRELEAENDRLRAEVAALRQEVAELRARLGMNSTNSSRPPSSDPPGMVRRKKPPAPNKAGAQVGHAPHRRTLAPPERVDHAVDHWPVACAGCAHRFALYPEAGPPERRQVVELPPMRALVTEHRLRRVQCPVCGEVSKGEAPAGVDAEITFGPWLSAFSAAVTVRLRASRRGLVRLLGDLVGPEAPTVGTVQRLLEEVSASLSSAYQEIGDAVRTSPAASVDETGWKKKGLRYWLWVAASPAFSYFRLARSRSAREREHLLGASYPGVVTSDRAGAYKALAPTRRQLCWAHLARDFAGWRAKGGLVGRLGRWAVAETERLFGLWHRFRAGEITRAELKRRLCPLKARMTRLLYHAFHAGDRTVRRTADELMNVWDALWSFATHDGVEPTNNEAERSLRTAVIWRKTSFGSKSEQGLRLVERLLTVAETAKKQERDLLEHLTAAVTAHRAGQAAPPLLTSR